MSRYEITVNPMREALLALRRFRLASGGRTRPTMLACSPDRYRDLCLSGGFDLILNADGEKTLDGARIVLDARISGYEARA